MAIITALLGAAKPTMKEGAGPGKTEKRLRDKLKKDGWTE